MDYYDFNTPISFGGVLNFLEGKTVSRRDWKDSHANKFINAWNRAVTANRILRVPAINKAYYAGGRQIGWLTFPEPPYKEILKNMRQSELIEEGGMCATREEFISKYFKGDKNKEVWVVRFKLDLFSNHEQNQECVHSIYSLVSAELDSLSNQLVDLKSSKLSKYRQPQEQSMVIISTPQSKPASKKKKAKRAIAEPAPLTTALLASPHKPTLRPSESNISKNSTKSSPLEVLTSSKSDEHHTPAWLIEAARKALGGRIDLDPMSNFRANQAVCASRFFTKEENALNLKWEGKIWINPAFSIADEAVDKVISEYELGNISEAVVLLKSAPETKRYQKMYPFSFCELNKRVTFDAQNNKTGAPFATVIFYIGRNFARFRAAFEPYGRVHIGDRLYKEMEARQLDLMADIDSADAESDMRVLRMSKIISALLTDGYEFQHLPTRSLINHSQILARVDSAFKGLSHAFYVDSSPHECRIIFKGGQHFVKRLSADNLWLNQDELICQTRLMAQIQYSKEMIASIIESTTIKELP